MKPTRNPESDWLLSFFILLYLLASQVKAKFSSILNSRFKSSEQTYDESNGIRICDWCHDFHYKRLKLPSLYILPRSRPKAALLYMAVFHFVLGIYKVTINNQTIFTKQQKMRLIISRKKKLEAN